jgi:hypothetical protein
MESYRQGVELLIKYFQGTVTLTVSYMEIDGEGHSFDCVFEVWLTDGGIINEDGGTGAILPQYGGILQVICHTSVPLFLEMVLRCFI